MMQHRRHSSGSEVQARRNAAAQPISEPTATAERGLDGNEATSTAAELNSEAEEDFELERRLACGLLTDEQQLLIESTVPGLQPGDIGAGRIGIRHLAKLDTELKVGIAFPGRSDLQHFTVEVISKDEIVLMANVIRRLDAWDAGRCRKGGRHGTQA